MTWWVSSGPVFQPGRVSSSASQRKRFPGRSPSPDRRPDTRRHGFQPRGRLSHSADLHPRRHGDDRPGALPCQTPVRAAARLDPVQPGAARRGVRDARLDQRYGHGAGGAARLAGLRQYALRTAVATSLQIFARISGKAAAEGGTAWLSSTSPAGAQTAYAITPTLPQFQNACAKLWSSIIAPIMVSSRNMTDPQSWFIECQQQLAERVGGPCSWPFASATTTGSKLRSRPSRTVGAWPLAVRWKRRSKARSRCCWRWTT
jgi:hypothetical protein